MNALSPRSRRSMTLADTLLAPRFADDRMLSPVSRLFLVLAGSGLLAISAQFAFRIPISPVPVTGQTLVVLMIGMTFGSRLGAATVLAYLVEGGMGLPVFANGAFGWPVVIGPTGGYLIGFCCRRLYNWLHGGTRRRTGPGFNRACHACGNRRDLSVRRHLARPVSRL